MKPFKNKKHKENKKKAAIIRIIIYAAAAAVVHFLSVNMPGESLRRFLTVVEIVLFAVILRAIVSLVHAPAKKLLKQFTKAINKIFKPYLDKIREKLAKGRKFVKGSDEKNLIWNFNLNIVNRLKNKLKLRKKLDFRHSSSNAEKIRLLYIKLILTLREKHHKIKYSSTPKEIKENLDHRENDVLFEVYEKIRYGGDGNITVSDDMVNSCEKTMDTYFG